MAASGQPHCHVLAEGFKSECSVAQLDVCSDESVAQCLSCIQGGEVDVLGESERLLGPLAASLAQAQSLIRARSLQRLNASPLASPATSGPLPLVNNAGVGLVGPIEGLSLAAMQKVFDTNFFGAVRLVKAVLPSSNPLRCRVQRSLRSLQVCSGGILRESSRPAAPVQHLVSGEWEEARRG